MPKRADSKYTYPIEKGVPIPESGYSILTSRARYPWAEMKVGDCFFAQDRNITQISSSLQGQYKAHPNDGKLYTIRTTNRGVGVWRVK